MLIINSFKIYSYTLPFNFPFPERKGLLLHLFFQETINCRIKEGWGEIAPLPSRSRETLQQAFEQMLFILKNPSLIPRTSLFASVAFGLHSALHYQRYALPLPLSALLAGTPENILEKTQLALQQGYTSGKLKIEGFSLPKTLELIQNLKQMIHSCSKPFRLRIDANRSLSFQDAMQIAESCGACLLDYIEEPTFELHQLENFSYPFALDESLLEMNALPKNAYLKTIVFKPSIMGLLQKKFYEKKEIVFSSACETGIGILSIASMAASFCEHIQPLGLDTYRFLKQDILVEPLNFSLGRLTLPSAIQVNPRFIEEVAHG